MKLVLASAGFLRSREIAIAAAELANKDLANLNVAVINEAKAIEAGDKTWLFNEMQKLRETASGKIDFIDLLALDIKTIEQRIEFADIIYVVGGHTDYLMSVYRRTGFDKLLRDKLLKEKVYVGSSAGAMVLGRRISTETYTEIYGEWQDFGIFEYMNEVDFAMLPHFDSPEFIQNRAENVARLIADFSHPVYALKDTQAVIVDNDKVSFVGGEPFTINPKK